MQTGTHPYISPDVVQIALTSIHSSTPPSQFESLLILRCVDEYMTQQMIPRASFDREFALRAILLNIIEDQYRLLREAVQLSPVSLDTCATFNCVQQIVVEDSLQDNRFLRSMSVLYARFNLVAFDIGVKEISNWLNTSQRNARRYFEHGYRLVAEELLALELETYRVHHQRRLRAKLPIFTGVQFGREHELQTLKRSYLDTDSQVILITGDSGMGKTHLVVNFCSYLLEMVNPPAHLFWIHEPTRVQDVQERISSEFHRSPTQLSLHDYLAMTHTLVVADNADAILQELSDLVKILGNSATLIILAQTELPEDTLQMASTHIQLSGLSADTFQQLFDYIKRQDAGRDSMPPVEDLYKQTNGNPGHLKLLMRSASSQVLYQNMSTSKPKNMIMDLMRSAPEIAHEIMLMSLFRQYPGSFHPSVEISENLKDQFRVWLSHDHDRLQNWLCSSEGHQDLLDSVVNRIVEDSNIPAGPRIQIIEDLIYKLSPDHDQRIRLIQWNWRQAYAQDRLHIWYRLTDQTYQNIVREDNWSLLLPQLVYHSDVGNDDTFQTLSDLALKATGRAGLFELQAEIMYYIARFNFQRSQFKPALRILEPLLARPYTGSDLKDRVQLKLTEIHIALLDPQTARRHYQQLSNPTWQAHLIDCELLYLEGKLAACVHQCERLIRHKEISTYPTYLGYLHALKAQAMTDTTSETSKDPDNSGDIINEIINQFSLSLYTLSMTTQNHLLARVTNNFGAFLVSIGKTENAQHLFEWAAEQQLEIEDHLGQAFTSHNLSISTHSPL